MINDNFSDIDRTGPLTVDSDIIRGCARMSGSILHFCLLYALLQSNAAR